MGFVGLIYSGPVSQFQHILFERLCPGQAMKAVFGKVVLGSALAPLTLALNFALVAALKGQNASEIKNKVQSDVGPTWIVGALYWPIIMTFNYRFVPLKDRALVGAASGALWHIYMSN